MPVKKIYILLLLSLLSLPFRAQMMEDDDSDIRFQMEVKKQLTRLTTELNNIAKDCNQPLHLTERNVLSSSYPAVLNRNAQSINRRMQEFNVRWEAFNASNLAYISDHETLMEMMTQTQMLKQAVTDTLAALQTRCSALKDFQEADRVITMQDSIYNELYKQAYAMSFVQKMAPQLEKLKAREQLNFTEIQALYDKSKGAADQVPQLQHHAAILNDRYSNIKTKSEKIQQMQYMPLFQRIKEYIMGIAYVSIILIFINMVITKWQTAKKAKEALKQQAEQLRKQQNDYPTI